MMKRITLFLTIAISLGLGLVTAQGQTHYGSLNGSDQVAVATNFQYALENNPIGTAANWRNPDTNHNGTTVPVKTFQIANGVYCREFQQTIIIDDRRQQAYGTACRQPDGSWQIVDPKAIHQPEQKSVSVTNNYVYDSPRRYAYPYWSYPSYLSFSFGHVSHRSHFSSGHRYFRGHNLHRGKSHHRGHKNKLHRGKSHNRGHGKHFNRSGGRGRGHR